MAKKEKKKSKKKENPGADAVGAVRTAVERTFHATADSAQSTRTRAQDLVDEVAGAAGRLREMIEQIGVLEDLKKQVEALARRVQALEGGGGASKPAASRAKASGTTARKPAASRSTAKRSRSTTARSTSSRAKPAASKRASTSSRSTAAKRASGTTRKPASRSTAAKKPSSS
jgi:hypothetical protein